jgi:hypothetical protein
LTERVKRTESRLDDGAETINKIKLYNNTLKSDVDHIVLSMRDHYQSSDTYRAETDDNLHEIEKKIGTIETRCIEREKAGKP